MSLTDWTILSATECRMLEVILQGDPPPDRLALKAEGGKVHVVTRHGDRRYFWLIVPTEDGSMLSLERVAVDNGKVYAKSHRNNSPVTVDTDDTVR